MSEANNPTSADEILLKQIEAWIQGLHQIAPDSIGDQLHFSVINCDAAERSCAFQVETADWMKNPYGTLHGGIIAAALDQGMGILAGSLKNGRGVTPSVQLNVTYHRPLIPGQSIMLKAYAESITKTLIHLRCDAFQAGAENKLCTSATGIYYFKPIEKTN